MRNVYELRLKLAMAGTCTVVLKVADQPLMLGSTQKMTNVRITLPSMTPAMFPIPPSTMMLSTAIDTEKLKSSARDDADDRSVERAGEPADGCADGECEQLGGRRVDAGRCGRHLILAQRHPCAADSRALDVAQQQDDRDNNDQDRPVVPAWTRAEVKGTVLRLVDARDAVGAGGQAEDVVGGEVRDDLPEAERDDGEIVAAQPESRRSQDCPEDRRDASPEKDEYPQGKVQIVDRGREGCARVRADREERGIAEVEQSGEPDDDVEPEGQQHVDRE